MVEIILLKALKSIYSYQDYPILFGGYGEM